VSEVSWDYVQTESDQILSDGLFKLRRQPYYDYFEISDKGVGNYLISLDNQPYYIGEAKELSKRIKQQFKPATSTFYKNFLKLQKTNQLIRPKPIDSFKVQTISTEIGRKEIEEFGIVNLPTRLNGFQLGKRKKSEIADQHGLWDKVQKCKSELLQEGGEKVFKNRFPSWFELQTFSTAGLYIVKDKTDKIIYIGERISTHSEKTYFSALRRHIGTDILGFILQERDGKKRYFSEPEDKKVTDFLRACKATIFPVTFGRYELEEYLIRKFRPLLNRKDNKD